MTAQTLLITGVSGYIGGTTLMTILESEEPWRYGLEISALIRNETQAQEVLRLGVTPVLLNNFDEAEKVESIAQSFDCEYPFIIHTGSGWHIQSAKAFIAGQSARSKKLGRAVHYLHVSGTSNLGDRPHSQRYMETRTFSDAEDIYAYEKYRESLEVYDQRTNDITVIESGENTGVTTYIVMAPLVFGLGSGPFNKHSMQLPMMIKASLASGRTLVPEDGMTEWSHIHVQDVAALFVCILKNAYAGNAIPSGRRGIYFAETGIHTHLELSKRIAAAGFKSGALESSEVKRASIEEVAHEWLDGMTNVAELAFASNARTKSVLGPRIGWRPARGDEWEKTVEAELKAYLPASTLMTPKPKEMN